MKQNVNDTILTFTIGQILYFPNPFSFFLFFNADCDPLHWLHDSLMVCNPPFEKYCSVLTIWMNKQVNNSVDETALAGYPARIYPNRIMHYFNPVFMESLGSYGVR